LNSVRVGENSCFQIKRPKKNMGSWRSGRVLKASNFRRRQRPQSFVYVHIERLLFKESGDLNPQKSNSKV